MRSFVTQMAKEQPNGIRLLNILAQQARHRQSFQMQAKAQEYGNKLC